MQHAIIFLTFKHYFYYLLREGGSKCNSHSTSYSATLPEMMMYKGIWLNQLWVKKSRKRADLFLITITFLQVLKQGWLHPTHPPTPLKTIWRFLPSLFYLGVW